MNFSNQNMNTENPRNLNVNSRRQVSNTNNASLSNLTSKGQLENVSGQYVLTLHDVPNNSFNINEVADKKSEIHSANIKNQEQGNKNNSSNNSNSNCNCNTSNGVNANNINANNSKTNNINTNNINTNNINTNNINTNNINTNNINTNNVNKSTSSIVDLRERLKPKKLFSVELPYPSIKVVEKNRDYALLLLHDYASSHSELTAITSYSYFHLVLSKEYKEIADAYRGISIVEMKHLELLGGFIYELGVLPRYYCNANNSVKMWDGSYVDGTVDLKTSLLNSIENELKGIEQYRKHIEAIDDIYIKKALNRIILDEELHVEILDNLYQKYCK